ncbi:uncharacterized protein LOC126743058 [Anthonomus grandis grandis]|uniref:uncharacterized protein LOC126743058 n=1 Tax=Anthonomus grandis grandis TaxID=2921223 RepID=UPI002165A0E1|nr:uncharacterized protein LOC126743058 [Anthonomus grandis grandis]
MSRRRMIMVTRPRIDSERLIEEVKKRPCIYSLKAGRGNENHELKNAAWGEIGAAMFTSGWDKTSIAEKDKYVRELQIKWRSLRDNFTRQLRIQEAVKAGVKSQAPKKYVFMDSLSFLLPYVSKRDKYMYTNNTSEEEASITDTNDSSVYCSEDIKPDVSSHDDELDVMEMSPIKPTETTPQPQIQLIPILPKPTPQTAFVSGAIDYNSITASHLKFTAANSQDDQPLKRVAACMEEMIQLQKDETADDPTGNKKFLLSLLPFMKKLPDDVNLEVRLQLVSVLETYIRGMNTK